eukprot:874621_1
MATLYCAMPHHTGTLFVLPSCLLTACFISPKSQNDGSEVTLENIQYFANAIQFELIGRSHMLTGAPLSYFIKRMYGMPHLTITPWTDATAFIELFEMLHAKYLQQSSIVDLFEKCIDIESDHLPLSILPQNRFRRIQKKDMELMHRNIDVLFEDFLIKYCVTEASVMENVLYQIINSLIYFLQWNVSNNTNALKGELINKLTHVAKTHMVPHIDCNEFIKTSKYKQSLANLKQIKSFETNLFEVKSEETSSEQQSRKRTAHQHAYDRPLKRTKLQ